MNKTTHLILAIVIAITITSCTNDAGSKTKPVWQIEQLKDEFGDKVEGETAIVANFNGKMYNSAVSGANLTVRMTLYDSLFFTDFFEYSTPPSAYLSDSDNVIIDLKLSNGEKIEVKQFLRKNLMCDFENELFDIILSQNKPIKVIVDLSKANEFSNATYYFEIDPTGLKDLLKKIENKN
jgi:hypothetical protein